MIQEMPFGRTGHDSIRAIFGAAALARVSQEKADAVLEMVVSRGLNHIDTAASYGDSELRLAPFLKRHRESFFLASKTGDRTYKDAMASIQRSLARLEVDHLDLIQLHNLVEPDEWATALGPDGALEAAMEARERGLVRFIGVTGHGTRVAEMHLKSLERFPFDSVLLPYNFTMMAQPDYAADFEALYEVCQQRGVAMQTIKSIARRRWQGEDGRRFSWYEPLREPEAIRRGVDFVFARPGLFLNTSSDATLLEATLDAATSARRTPSTVELQEDVARHQMEPLFVRGVSDAI
ncbi:MAG TPA: aldo/keto reductase [Tepidiformaceae bacterium]|nr:aldo/keto reductase [Tepidiformaceae bacterium]